MNLHRINSKNDRPEPKRGENIPERISNPAGRLTRHCHTDTFCFIMLNTHTVYRSKECKNIAKDKGVDKRYGINAKCTYNSQNHKPRITRAAFRRGRHLV